MTEPHDPNKTVDASSAPDDSLDARLTAGLGPQFSVGTSRRPVPLRG